MGTVDLSGSAPVLTAGDGADEAQGVVPGGETVVQGSSASDNWRLSVAGREAEHRAAYGWADAFEVDGGGQGELVYRTPVGVRLLAAVQAVLWLLALGVALRMRFGAGDPPPPRRPRGRAGDPSTRAVPQADAPAAGDGVAAPPAPHREVPPGPGSEPSEPERVPVGPAARR
jgi:hypothetical protein